MKQLIYQEKLARIRQKKLIWGDLNFWGGIGGVIIGIIFCFQTGAFGSHPLLGWGVFLIIAGVVGIAIGRHYITTCDREYEQTLRELEGKTKKRTRRSSSKSRSS